MAYLNFTDALMESKRRARLQGREVTQQEAAGISEGVAKSAGDRSVQIEQLAQNKEQYERSLAQREKEFGQSYELQERGFDEQIKNNEKQYGMAVRTLEAQISQYEQSSAAQQAQFGKQMKFQIDQSAKQVKQYEQQLATQKKQFRDQYAAQQRNFDLQLAEDRRKTDAQIAAANNQGGSGTWICTATKDNAGLTPREEKTIKLFRKYVRENFSAEFSIYLKEGPKLIYAIAAEQKDIMGFYQRIRQTLIEPVVRLSDEGDYMGAYELYKSVTILLASIYVPDVLEKALDSITVKNQPYFLRKTTRFRKMLRVFFGGFRRLQHGLS